MVGFLVVLMFVSPVAYDYYRRKRQARRPSAKSAAPQPRENRYRTYSPSLQ